MSQYNFVTVKKNKVRGIPEDIRKYDLYNLNTNKNSLILPGLTPTQTPIPSSPTTPIQSPPSTPTSPRNSSKLYTTQFLNPKYLLELGCPSNSSTSRSSSRKNPKQKDSDPLSEPSKTPQNIDMKKFDNYEMILDNNTVSWKRKINNGNENHTVKRRALRKKGKLERSSTDYLEDEMIGRVKEMFSYSEKKIVPEYIDSDSDIEILRSESWVDLSPSEVDEGSTSPSMTDQDDDQITPLPFNNGDEYLRILKEAQKDSTTSSARVSLASSRRDTPRDSPKSPPNSPNTEIVTDNEDPRGMDGVLINYYNKEGDFVRVEKNIETDWIWDWSSRPDQVPPKQWKFNRPTHSLRGVSIRRAMVGNSALFSRDVLYTLLVTNVLSLLIGAGIGLWLSKKSGSNVTSLAAIPYH